MTVKLATYENKHRRLTGRPVQCGVTSLPELELQACYENEAFPFSQGKQTISLADQYLLTAINPERAGEHFYVNYVNLNSLATRDVRGAIQLSKLDGREGRKIKRNSNKKRTLV